MSTPSLEDRLAQVLTDTTADLTTPPLAPAAWSGARAVRRRRRAALAAAGVLTTTAAVAAVLVLPGVAAPRASVHGDPVQPAHPVAAARTQVTSTPTRRDQVQPTWDPATFARLPVLDLGLPDLRPDPATATPIAAAPMDRAVAVVKEYGGGGTFYALGEDGRWRSVDTGAEADIDNSGLAGRPHEPALRGPFLRPGALSADGRYVVLEGHRYQEVYDLQEARASRIPGEWFSSLWTPQDRLLLKGDADASYDPATGRSTPADVDLGEAGMPIVAGYSPDGAYTVARNGSTPPTLRVGGTTVRGLEQGPAVSLAAGDDLLGLSTFPEIAGPRATLVQRGDGLLAVSTSTGAAVAFLPIRDQHQDNLLTERLVPRFWLDDDTLVFSVRPQTGPGTGTYDIPGAQLLVAWHPSTGRLERIAATTNQWRDLSLARDLLVGRRG